MGEPKRVVDAYLQDVTEKQEEDFEKRQQEVEEEVTYTEERRENRWGKREIEIKKVKLLSEKGQDKHVFHPDEGMIIAMDVTSYSKIKDFVVGIGIFNSQGICCYGTNTHLEKYESQSIDGEGKIIFRIEKMNLINGTYYLDLAVHKKDGYPYDYHRNLYSFLISSTCKDVGISRPDHSWEFFGNIKIKSTKKN